MKKLYVLILAILFSSVVSANGFNPFEQQKAAQPASISLETILKLMDRAAENSADVGSLRSFKQMMIKHSDRIAKAIDGIDEVNQDTVDAILLRVEGFILAEKDLADSQQVFTVEDKEYIYQLLLKVVAKLPSKTKMARFSPLLSYICEHVVGAVVQNCHDNEMAVNNLYMFVVLKNLHPAEMGAATLDDTANMAVSYALQRKAMLAGVLYNDVHQKNVVDQRVPRPAVLQAVKTKSEREQEEQLTFMEEFLNLDDALAEE